jgi:hypothetical protein
LASVLACSKGDQSSGGRTDTGSPTTPSAQPTTPGGDDSDPTGSDFGNSGSQPAAMPSTPPSVQPGLDDMTCARADVYVERIRPRIVFLVDASSSMSEDFGGVTRWNALREALLADDGLIPTLQALVKFGLVTYQGPRYTTCPSYRYSAPAPGNVDLIAAAFPNAPPDESSTPTGEAMDWAIDNAFLDQVPSPDEPWEAQFMIFATDGEPNGCAQGSTDEPPRDFASVIAAAHKAASRSIGVFVISLAEATGEFADHLQEVATIGGTDTVYSPQSKAELVTELQNIIGAAISCQVELTAGAIREGRECTGEVLLNSDPLECDGENGFELVDSTHILLKGSACDDFKLDPNASLSATFPCEAIE